jgi:hypothetical protein
MKKSLLFVIAGCLSASTFAQNKPAIYHNRNLQNVPSMKVDRSQTKASEVIVPLQAPAIVSNLNEPSVTRVIAPNLTSTTIGRTIYDLQSNRGAGRRITNNGNGTYSADWTMTPVGGSISTTRGTGYNYYNGSSWGSFPTTIIEPLRTGFTNLFEKDGDLFVATHTGANGICLSQKPVASGSWNSTYPLGTYNLFPSQADVWSRIAVSGTPGNTYVHMIVNSQGTGTSPVLNMNGPLTYTRTLNGTVIDDHIQLPGMTDAEYLGFSAENYSIDARGSTVVIVAGGFDTDLALWKSTDDGATWTKTIIYQFPIPLYDGTTTILDIDNDGLDDTIVVPSEDPTVSIDKNGMAHVTVGGGLILNADGTGIRIYFTDLGLFYWNESMPAWTQNDLETGSVVIAAAQDFNNNGAIDYATPAAGAPYGPYGLYAVTTQSSIGFDDNNDIYVTYATVNELADTIQYKASHRHIYVIRSNDGGATWGEPFNIVPNPEPGGGDGEYIEAVWPSIIRDIPGSGSSATASIVYQSDAAPYYSSLSAAVSTTAWLATMQGWNQNASLVPNPNDIIVATVSDIPVGIKTTEAIVSEVTVAPNPAKNFVNVAFNMNKSENVTIQFSDVLGRVVLSQNLGTIASGKSIQKVNISKLNSGIYIYSLMTSKGIKSGKLVVE